VIVSATLWLQQDARVKAISGATLNSNADKGPERLSPRIGSAAASEGLALWAAAEVTLGGAITAMAVNDFVSRWEQMRNDIERQLAMPRSGQIETHDGTQNTTAETIERLRELRGKLELLLTNHRGYESHKGEGPS
jgi:hypothetical protein